MDQSAAIYARFSSDLQRDRSIEDQAALCREFASRNGFCVVAAFEDRARSGASVLGRDGLMRLLDAAREGLFRTVIVEALDRLSRDQEDLAGIYKRLSFLGVDILAVHDGRADQVQVGIRGLVGALYLQDLAHKVRRGMAGVVRDGRHAGGRAYGYRPVPGAPGALEIVAEEAAIVRRIFESYRAGSSPRAIAAELNREGAPPPRGRHWTASAINGNVKRGAGILHNELYAGRLIWNKVRMVRDPDTGRRVSRPNPSEQWQRADAPHLRIVEPEIFDAVRRLKAEGYRPCAPRRRTPKRMLSGLLHCGVCGGGMSIKDRDHGRLRIVCTAMKEAGACANRRVFYLDAIERAVVDGLRARLADRSAIALFVRAYNEETRKLFAQASKSQARLRIKLARAQGRLDRAIEALIDGAVSKHEGAAHIAAARAERDAAKAELALADAPPQPVVLHPETVRRYLATIDRLADAVAGCDAAAGSREPRGAAAIDEAAAAPEVMQAIRDLIDSVTVRSEGGEVVLEVQGHLAALIGRDVFPHARLSGGSLVAEDRYILTPRAVRPPFSFRCCA